MHATVSSVLSTRHKLAPMHDCYRLGAPRNSRATIAAPSGASAVAMVTLSTLTSTCKAPNLNEVTASTVSTSRNNVSGPSLVRLSRRFNKATRTAAALAAAAGQVQNSVAH